MELRTWAQAILEADTLEGKLARPHLLTDDEPGPAVPWKEPTRPPGMGFSPRRKEEKLPSFQEHGDPDKRAICLHRFAGHELLAVEMMAFTLLAFPEAPKHFRRGLANTLVEEQGHVRIYMERMSQLGVQFGDMPLYRHFWKHTPFILSPLHYVSAMSLTFEMANLDFAPMYGQSFLHHGDKESAKLMATILEDEVSHVSFGYHWLQKFKSRDMSEWDAWLNSLNIMITPRRARGFQFNAKSRQEAGLSQLWIDNLNSS